MDVTSNHLFPKRNLDSPRMHSNTLCRAATRVCLFRDTLKGIPVAHVIKLQSKPGPKIFSLTRHPN